MSDDPEEEKFDVCQEPQANRFHEVKQLVARDVRDHNLEQDYQYLLASAINDLREPRIPVRPEKPPEDASEGDKALWKHALEYYCDATLNRERNLQLLYDVVWDRCTIDMTISLESRRDFDDIKEKKNGIELLKAIKTISYSYPANIHPAVAVLDATQKFVTFSQAPDMSLLDYKSEFMKRWEVLKTVGGGGIAIVPYLAGTDSSRTKKKKGAPPEGQSDEDITKSFHAVAFIRQADPARFGSLQEFLERNFLFGDDTYPRTVYGAYEMLSHWTPPGGRSDFERRGVTCFRCRQRGHYRNECPRNNATGEGSSSQHTA